MHACMLAAILAAGAAAASPYPKFLSPVAGDVDYSGTVNAIDVQLVINAALGIVIDRDGDGLPDVTEARLGTNPNLADSDGNGMTDLEEYLGETLPAPSTDFVEVPDPLAGDNPAYLLPADTVPAPGEGVTDAAFGLTQVRVTQTPGLRHEYARFDPFNAGRTRILLFAVHDGEWRVYRTASLPYDTPAQFVRAVELDEPRWDPAAPNLLWGLDGFEIVRLNVETGARETIKDFAADPVLAPILSANPDLYRVTMRDEGESSWDKRFWALLLQGSAEDDRVRYLITWDRQVDEILGTYAIPLSESLIDWAGMSPLGNWVLIGGDWDNGGGLIGLTMADKALSWFHRLDYTTAHADVALDSNGGEVVVMQNTRTDYIDLIPLDAATLPILDAGGSYAGTNRTPLLRLNYETGSPTGFNSGVHISANFPGYCVVSTYTEPGMPEQNWLDRSIVLVSLDPAQPRAWHLGKVFGTTGAYWEETQAAMSNDGETIVWATNWGQDVGLEQVWVMQLDLPIGWASALR